MTTFPITPEDACARFARDHFNLGHHYFVADDQRSVTCDCGGSCTVQGDSIVVVHGGPAR